jgi:uncharacterized membrane-anchored protein YitT (DUF2179 family)
MKRIYSYLLIHLGILLVTAGIVLFKIPNNFATGGVTGISLVLNRLFPSLSIGFLMLSLNIMLIIVGLLFTDFEFEKRTIYSTIVLSLLVWYFQNTYPIRTPLTGDTMLELIAAIILLAAGSALLFYQNASGGGTDIIAKIINLRTHLHIGKTVLISDLVISILAMSVFGIKIGIYSIVGVIIKGFLIDAIIEGLHGSKQVFVISSKTSAIKKFIMENIGRGVTIYSAIGGHTNTEKEVLNTIMSRKETIKLKDYVKLIDKEAFVVVGNVSEIMGSGFNKL